MIPLHQGHGRPLLSALCGFIHRHTHSRARAHATVYFWSGWCTKLTRPWAGHAWVTVTGSTTLEIKPFLECVLDTLEAMKGREGVAWQHLEQSMTPSLFGSLRMSSEKRGPQRDAQKLQVHSGAPLTPGFQGLQPTFPASAGCVSCHAVHTEGSVLLTPFHTSCFQAPGPSHMSISFGKGSLPPPSPPGPRSQVPCLWRWLMPEWCITLFVVKNLERPWG